MQYKNVALIIWYMFSYYIFNNYILQFIESNIMYYKKTE